jgi:cell wall-associated NlpC family hydrolase
LRLVKINKLSLLLVSLSFSCLLADAQTGKNNTVRQPKFINDVVMNTHNKTNSTVVVKDNVAAGSAAEKSETEIKQVTSATPPVFGTKIEVAPAIVPSKSLISNSIIGKYAEILGAGIEEIACHFSLYSFIEEWYGTDYRLGGKDKSGIDCSAFVQKLYEQVFGIDMLRTALEQFKNCKITHDLSNAKEGDLVFFHINSKRITHVGIYLANNYFVHASSANGVVINNLKDKYYQKYLAGIGKLSGK